MAKLKNNEPVSKRVRINSRDLLIFTNRGTAGKDYEALQDAIERIRGTTISTNIRTGDEEQIDTFGLIDASSIRRKHGLDGRLISCEITLSDWVFNAIRHNEVLTLHRDYFRLRRPIERRIYELARKHCGQQVSWKVSLEIVLKKSGSKSSEKEFRRTLRKLAATDHLPDYHVTFGEREGMVTFKNRGTMKAALAWTGQLDADVFGDACNASLGWDIHYLEQEWRLWPGENEIVPKHPEPHFVKFCQSWFEKRGRP